MFCETLATPETPETVNVVPPPQLVPVPVRVSKILPAWFVGIAVGEAVAVGLATVTVDVSEPSEIVSVPVPDPVSTVIVAAVVDETDCDALVAPETPETLNVVPPLDHDVPKPVRVIFWPDALLE